MYDVLISRLRGAVLRLLLLALLPAVSAQAGSLTYLVGADAPTCDFYNLQAAINAAQAHPGPDTIRVATNLTHAAQALKVGSQELAIEGGFATCASTEPASPTAKTTLGGAGGAADSVIEFGGSGLRVLRGLRLTGGDDPVSGGGIQVDSQGQVAHLFLENVEIIGNASSFGGGINFHGDGSARSSLTLGREVVVQANLASESGGGIRVTGNAVFNMVVERVAVTGNEAQGLSSDQSGHGGGILIVGPASAQIASPGFTGTAISNNVAKYGGGLAVIAPDDSSNVNLYSVAADPLLISANRASRQGGGIYLGGSDNGFEGGACINAFDVSIEENVAPVGAAVALNEFSAFTLNYSGPMFIQCTAPSRPASSVPCSAANPLLCSRIARNRSEDAGGDAADGAVVSVREDARAISVLSAVTIGGNTGGQLLHGASCTGCLLADNIVAGSLAIFPSDDDSDYALEHSTIAGNSVGGNELLRVGDGLSLRNSVIQQPGKQVFTGSGVDAENLLVSSCGLISCTSFPNVTAVATGPRFVDAARGDYRLQAASAAVDFAPAGDAEETDVDGVPRDRDLVPKPDRLGIRDLGAYERQDLEPLVLNADFVDDFHPWQVVPPAAATFQETGAEGSPGGSVLISDGDQLALDEVVGLHQCVPLPGPGTWRLNGRAAGQGLISSTRDRVRLRWRYYPETTSNDCTGSATQGGDVLFPNAATMSAPLQDAFIVADVGEFNERTQVAVELVAIEGNTFTANDSTGGMFDAIRLFLDSDVIFADGFD